MTTDKSTTPGHPEFEPSGSLPVRPQIGTFEADGSNINADALGKMIPAIGTFEADGSNIDAVALGKMIPAIHFDKWSDAAALDRLLAALDADDVEDGGR